MNEPPLIEAERNNQPEVHVPGVSALGVPTSEEHFGDNYNEGNYHGDNENNDNICMDAMADAE